MRSLYLTRVCSPASDWYHTRMYRKYSERFLNHLALPQAKSDVSQYNYSVFFLLVCWRCANKLLLWF